MIHLLFIDPLEKLNIKKDSTLMMALTFKKAGIETYLLFENDFYYQNRGEKGFKVYDFDGGFKEGSFYLKEFKLTTAKTIQLNSKVTLHMRIDPPFDTRYLRYLWILRTFKDTGVQIINDPEYILLNNEKLVAYEEPSSLPTYIGSSFNKFYQFVQGQESMGKKNIILKPLDLYQGLGVEKLPLTNISESEWHLIFDKKVKELKGPLVAQEYAASVEQGEVRAVYFKGQEIGSILKVPPKGGFLANIASGASYAKTELTKEQRILCERFCKKIGLNEVPWIAFDLLGNSISEANITCPGLLVEVSSAMERNLAATILELL